VLEFAKNFPDSSFRPVSGHRVSYLFRGDDAQPLSIQFIGDEKDGAQSFYPFLFPFLHDLLKLGPFDQPFSFFEREILH